MVVLCRFGCCRSDNIYWIDCCVRYFIFNLYLCYDDTGPTFEESKRINDAIKYNNYQFTCPQCGSKKVKRIGNLERGTSVYLVGLASGKIGKQYHCDNCKHNW